MYSYDYNTRKRIGTSVKHIEWSREVKIFTKKLYKLVFVSTCSFPCMKKIRFTVQLSQDKEENSNFII
jgi:hypothetical protein